MSRERKEDASSSSASEGEDDIEKQQRVVTTAANSGSTALSLLQAKRHRQPTQAHDDTATNNNNNEATTTTTGSRLRAALTRRRRSREIPPQTEEGTKRERRSLLPSKRQEDSEDSGEETSRLLRGKRTSLGKRGVVNKPVPAWRVDDDDLAKLPADAEAAYMAQGNLEEVARYIAVDFRDGTGPQPTAPDQVNEVFSRVEKDMDASGVRERYVVYVESATTGRFFRFNLRASDPLHHQLESAMEGRKPLLEGGQGPLKDPRLTILYSNHELALLEVEWWWGFILLILQGILAGCSSWLFFTTLLSKFSSIFMMSYAGLAGESRRFFFIMTTVSLLGSLDGLIRARKNQEKWEEVLTRIERLEIFVQVGLYFLALLATLMAGFFDMHLYYYKWLNGSSTTWYDTFISSKSHQQQLAQWVICSGIRCVASLVGWMVSCKINQNELRRNNRAWKEVKYMSDTLDKAELRLAHLAGLRLETLKGKAALQELISQQRQGIMNTENALEHLARVSSARGKT